MNQHQAGEGQASTQDFVHPRGYLRSQHYLHHGRPQLEFSQSASNISFDVLSPTSERSENSGDTDIYELS